MPLTGTVDGGAMEPSMLGEDSCGLLAHGPRAIVLQMIARHFHIKHPEIQPVVDGVHFTIRESPDKCDVCGVVAELPWWSHVSDPPTDSAQVIDNDGLWLLCDPCHELLAQRKTAAWVRRCMAQLAEQRNDIATMPLEAKIETRVYVYDMLSRLVRNLDEGKRETIFTGVQR